MPLSRFHPDPALRDFVLLHRGAARALVRHGLEEEAGRLELEEGRGGGVAEVSGGRQAHPLVELADGTRAVVRRYRRGGAMRHLNRERYFSGHRAFDELLATERARAAGVRVPEVLAAVERSRGLGYTATLATRWISGAVELASWLPERNAAERAAAMEAVGGEVGRMHAAGVAHPDLNLRNFLVAGAPSEAYVIDFDRSRLFSGPVPPARRARDLLRLARSARKLAAPVDGAAWAAFRAGYGSGWPLSGDLG